MLALFLVGVWHSGLAQLVFIPDTNLRNWLTSYSATCVDANGWFDPSDPDILADTSFSIMTWSGYDLTGFEALPNCRHLSMGSSDDAFSLATILAFPDSLRTLWMEDYEELTSLPNLPPKLQVMGLYRCGVDTIGTLPPELESLGLDQMSNLVQLPALPGSLRGLRVANAPQFSGPPALPVGIESLAIENCPLVTALPWIPQTLRQLRLWYLPLFNTWPTWSDSLREIDLRILPGLTGTLPPLPDSCSFLYLDQLAGLDSIGGLNATLGFLGVHSSPLIQEIPDPLPPRLGVLEVASCPLVTCLPWLHDSMIVYVEFNGFDCIPNYPTNAFTLYPVWMRSRPCSIYGPACVTPRITGTTYQDLNANGVRDLGEPSQPYSQVDLQPDLGSVWSDAAGFYQAAAGPGAYTITASPSSYSSSVAPLAHTANLLAPADQDSLNDFGYVNIPGMQDIRVEVVQDHAWSGFDNNLWLVVRNTGTVAVTATATLTLDTVCSFISSDLTPSFQSGQICEWSFSTLQPGAWVTIKVLVHTEVVQFGTPFSQQVVVLPIAGDLVPADNSMVFQGSVVGAFDPNDKQVSPSVLSPDEVALGTPVTYTIRFQNTGNFLAARVVITDTLSTDLEVGTLEVLGFSHPMTWSIHGRVASFVFDDIMLPGSTADEPGSHGFVRFRVRPDQSLQVGDSVSNSANIYFDFNEPVITAPAVFVVDQTASMESVPNDQFRLSPNPVSDELFLSGQGLSLGTPWTITDAAGTFVLSGRTSGSSARILVRSLAPGAYVLRTVNEQGTQAARFIKY